MPDISLERLDELQRAEKELAALWLAVGNAIPLLQEDAANLESSARFCSNPGTIQEIVGRALLRRVAVQELLYPFAANSSIQQDNPPKGGKS